MFDVNNLVGEEVFVAEQEVISTAATTVTTEELTLAQALKDLKISKPKVKRIVILKQEEPGKSKTTTITKQQSHDKGKVIIIKEPVKPKKKDQIRLDKEATKRLQVEFDKEERLAREKAQKEQEANIALIETWDDIQVKIDVDHQLVKRIQVQEQEELSDVEKATLFQYLLEKRRKHFASKRVEEERNKPSTQAQKKKIMSFRRVNTFEDFRSELVEKKEKRAGEELIQESTKKQKVEDEKETVELKQLIEIIPNKEEVSINVIPLDVKSPGIVDWKIYKEGNKSYYQIIRADDAVSTAGELQ
nr:hypothetical protein [Tanacetum cinerariifolium]